MTSIKNLSIAVISGKGGVGKTNVALNLAYALHGAKQRVLLMDCDLGLANLDVLLGITPKASIEQVLAGETSIADVGVEIEPNGFTLLPASSGVSLFADNNSSVRESALVTLNEFASPYDYFLLDAGAGISESVRTFAAKAMMRLVVITPEPTSITDAYALIKVLSSQNGVTDFHVLVNQEESPNEAEAAFARLAGACEKFLGITLRSLGSIKADATLLEAVRKQTPLLKLAPSCPAAKGIIAVAVRIHSLRRTMEETQATPLKLS